jgi:penicillin-binding protein 1A
LYLPGVECLYRAVVTATTVPGDAPADDPTPDAPGTPDGDVTEQAPPTTVPPPADPPTGTTVPGDPSATTVPPTPVYTAIDSGTTIPPDVLDPRAPLPTAPRSVYVAPCR